MAPAGGPPRAEAHPHRRHDDHGPPAGAGAARSANELVALVGPSPVSRTRRGRTGRPDRSDLTPLERWDVLAVAAVALVVFPVDHLGQLAGLMFTIMLVGRATFLIDIPELQDRIDQRLDLAGSDRAQASATDPEGILAELPVERRAQIGLDRHLHGIQKRGSRVARWRGETGTQQGCVQHEPAALGVRVRRRSSATSPYSVPAKSRTYPALPSTRSCSAIMLCTASICPGSKS
jgi:hypothetical protein